MPDPIIRGRRRWLWLLVLGVPLLAALALFRWFETMPVGTGETRRSPDGRYEASVMDYSARDFFTGAPRRWFAFRVNGPDTSYELTSTPLPGPYFGSRSSTSVIRWEPDSSAVRFVFSSSELQFKVGAHKDR
ncbi:hypothetical protein [Bosea sp. (in: a-proteobacteria)]|jgi:hypothetical protein|uniref:hypothetical protein n=1 Tax=Bosea sp. (in: a-proteobacteria) TaxID=1871050 RepID=UPI002DDDA4C9|nr:hypothetical protein [Bosea sp. (in: a-proteobacteria)]HEV2512885.1 hypothetical protein [Bosea sp. (in: a-proteobacteria)]